MTKEKRLLSLILCTSLMVTSLSTNGFANTESVKDTILEMGDADLDGDVDLQDVLMLEKYIVGENDVEINPSNTDINVDGVVDDTDVSLIKDYLVGNIDSLVLETCTVTFNTNGGGEIAPITVGKGYSIKSEIPVASKIDGIFAGWEMSDGSTFCQADPINEDIILNAIYEEIPVEEEQNINSFALTEQKPDLFFTVEGDYKSATEVEENITFVSMDGNSAVELEVTKENGGSFIIKAKEGFTEGGSYSMTLGEGLSFADKGEEIRTVNFVIDREEEDNFKYSDSLIFVKDTEEMKYKIDGADEFLDMIETALFTNDESGIEFVSGTFDMTGSELEKGDVICIYENVDPRERDYTEDNYQNDRMAYVKITGVEGDTYSFESLSEDDADEVIMMPDTIPFMVDTLPEGEEGTVNVNDYDATTRIMIGIKDVPEYNVGDILVFYAVDGDMVDENTKAVYGQVTKRDGDTVYYTTVTTDYIEKYMALFVETEVDSDEIIEGMNEKNTLSEIEKEAESSGFIDEAIPEMIESAMESDDVVKTLSNSGFTETEISTLKTMAESSMTKSNGGDLEFVVEKKDVKADYGKGSRYDDSVKVILYFDVVLSVNRKVGGDVHSVKLEINASFDEEVGVGVDAGIDADWGWHFIFPYLKEVSVDVAVDVQNFTSASMGVNIYTIIGDDDKKLWDNLTENTNTKETQDKLRELNVLEAKAEKEQDEAKKKTLLEAIGKLKKELPEITVDSKKYSFEEIWKELDKENVADFVANAVSANEDEAQIFVQKLMDKYSKMVGQETDWIELVDKEIISYQFNIYCVAIKLSGNIVIRTQANISMGSNADYQFGKRYTFWINILSGSSGSNEMDILDQRFGFQFYVMGKFALRAGIKLSVDIGLISADLVSVGVNAEFGPYMEMYGYFVYVYTKHRPTNTGTWVDDEEMLGAMFFELGLYTTLRFKAQTLAETTKYEKILIDKKWPLLTTGVKSSVYDFANDVEDDEVLVIRDEDNDTSNGITMKLPDSYHQMKTIMLLTGEQKQMIYDRSNYIYTVQDSKFSVDKNGVVTVNPDDTDRYLKSYITITWKNSKYAFSKYDIAITIPVVWTNMTTDEMDEKFTASVAVGNLTDGYDIVWSDKFGRFDSFDLPSEETILDIIGYGEYNDQNSNLKYDEVIGYQTESTDLSITSDTTYYFDINKKEYVVTVNGVQNQDGTVESRTYTAQYGGKFDFSDLKNTGANNPENVTYTEFSNLTLATDESEVFDENVAVNSAFVKAYGTSVELNANYFDDTSEATFTFIGIDAPEVKERFKNGQVPYFEGISEYVVKYGGEGTKIKSISPTLTNATSDIKYVVVCCVAIPEPKYTFSFDTNGGNDIKTQEYTEGSVILRPTDPVRTGYTFAGWYSDENCNELFSFDSIMPGENKTIYAKWIANSYKVTLISNGTVYDIMTATYDEIYGALKEPAKQENFRFEGWYTATTDGIQVVSETVFKETKDVTLYAKWVEKNTIPTTAILSEKTNTAYNEQAHPYTVKLSGVYEGIDGFVVSYKKQGTNTWTTSAPVNVGTYDVKFYRPKDDDYKYFSEYTINGAIVIDKGTLTLGTVKAYRNGKNVVISLPDGAKGDGKVTYYLGSASNTTGVFSNVSSDATCYVYIDEGTNYKAATSGKTSTITNQGSYVSGKYSVALNFKVYNELGGDLLHKLYGGLLFADGTKTGDIYLGDAFYLDKEYEYNIYSNVEPWQIAGYRYNIEDRAILNPEITLSWTKIKIKENGTTKWTATHNGRNEFGESGMSHSMSDFKRKVSSTGNLMENAGTSNWNIIDGKDYTFNYDGLITDQFLTYDPFVRYGSPTFMVTSGNVEYDKFIRYTGVHTFRIDGNALRNYVKINGGSNFSYTVTLTMPTQTCTGTTTFTRTISVNVSDYLSSLSSASSLSTYSLNDDVENRYAIIRKSAEAQNDGVDSSSDNTVVYDEKDVIRVPVTMNKDASVWGVLANVKYDSSLFKLVGYEFGDVYTEDEFTMQKDMTKEGFKFIITNDSIENNSPTEGLLILKFVKAQKEIADGSYNIEIETIQAINSDAQDVNVKFDVYRVVNEEADDEETTTVEPSINEKDTTQVVDNEETTTVRTSISEKGTTQVAKQNKKPSIKVNIKKTKIVKIKNAKKSLKVFWKKVKKTNGYQLQYSTSKKFKNARKITVKNVNNTSRTIKKLKSKKKYYVRIRAYKIVGGKKVFAKWSNAKSKKTK